MGIANVLARVRAAWVNADRNRRELEMHIAAYNTPAMSPAHRRELDEALDRILGRCAAQTGDAGH